MTGIEFLKNIRRKIRNFFMQSGIPVLLLKYFYKILCATLRYEQDRCAIAQEDAIATARKNGEEKNPMPVVFCLWHDELFPIMYLQQDLEIICIVSGSKDGLILENTLKSLGLYTATGSSRRGGLKALLTVVRLVDEHGWHACITVDGPMGPRHKVKDGAFLLAYKNKSRIVPLRLEMSSSWKLKSWDRFQIPMPFSKVKFIAGQGFFVNQELSEENLTMYRQRLENELEVLSPYKNKNIDEISQKSKL